MNNHANLDVIHVNDVNLWAHVGVLEEERMNGQDYLLNFDVWLDFSEVIKSDNVSATIDYSIAIKGLQQLAFNSQSLTIESFSQEVLDFLEGLYGSVPIQIKLIKCNPPVKGFLGHVSIQRSRNFLP